MGWFRRWFLDAKNPHLVQGAHYQDQFTARLGPRKLETRRVLSISAGLNLEGLSIPADVDPPVSVGYDVSATPNAAGTSSTGAAGAVTGPYGFVTPAGNLELDGSARNGATPPVATPPVSSRVVDGMGAAANHGHSSSPVNDDAVRGEAGPLDAWGEVVVDISIAPDASTGTQNDQAPKDTGNEPWAGDDPSGSDNPPTGNDVSGSDDVSSGDGASDGPYKGELPTNFPGSDFDFPLVPPPPVDPPPAPLPVSRPTAGPELPIAQIISINSVDERESGIFRSVMLDESKLDIAEIARVEFGLVNEDFTEWQDQEALMEVLEWDPDSPDFVAEVKDRILNNIRQEPSKPDWVPGNYMIRRFDKSGVEVDLITFRKVQLPKALDNDVTGDADSDLKFDDTFLFSTPPPVEAASLATGSAASRVAGWQVWQREQQQTVGSSRGSETDLKEQAEQGPVSESGVLAGSNVSQSEASRMNGLFVTSLSVAANQTAAKQTKQRGPEAVGEALVRHSKK